MLHGIVKIKAWILAILSVVFCSRVKSITIPSESVDVAKSVYNFYKPSGISVIHDIQNIDFHVKKKMLDVVRQFSRDFIISQVITYEQLEALMHYTSAYDEENYARSLQPLDPLYMLIITEENSVEHFQSLLRFKPYEVDASPWFIYVVHENETANYFDCAKPRGNPFNLKLESRIMVKCSNDKYLRRYYSVWSNKTEVVQLDGWTPGRKLTHKDMRNQYHKTTHMNDNWQFTFKVAQQNAISTAFNGNQQKFLSIIINELREISVFDFKVAVEEDILGYRRDNKEWFGLTRILKEKRADLAAALFSMSKTRMLALDFTLPLMRAKCGFYAKLPDSINIKWSAYFDVLGTYAWLIMVLLIFIISIVLYLLKKDYRNRTVPATLFFENIINIFGVFTQQGLLEVRTNTTIQVLYFSMFISSLIVNAVYSALITSYIAVMTASLPFSNYTDFLLNKDYKVLVLKGSRDEDLATSDGDKLLSPLKDRLEKSDSLPIHYYEGFVKACQENTAYYSNDVYYEGISKNLPCTLGFLTIDRYEFLSLALVKNSPYTKTINYFILRLMNNGILQRQKMQYFYKYKEIVINKPNYITLWEIVPLLSILGLGVLASLIILFIEIAVRRLHFNYRKTNRVNYLKLLLIEKKAG